MFYIVGRLVLRPATYCQYLLTPFPPPIVKYGHFLLLLLVPSLGYAQQARPLISPDSSKQSLSALPAGSTGNTPAPAQWRQADTRAVLVGLKVGGALTAKGGGNVQSVPETTFLPGGVAGVYGSIPLRWVGPRSPISFTLQPELLASMQGSRYNRPGDGYFVSLRLYYICLPVLLTANFHGFFLEGGVQGGYLMAVRERYEFVWNSVPSVNTNNRTTGYQRQELAFVGGAGYRSKMGLGLELRYVQGITNLYNDTSTLYYATPTGQHNIGYHVQLSYPLFGKATRQLAHHQ